MKREKVLLRDYTQQRNPGAKPKRQHGIDHAALKTSCRKDIKHMVIHEIMDSLQGA